MNESVIKGPVIAINKRGQAEFHTAIEGLYRPVLSSVRSGDLDEVLVLSSSGDIYRMTGPQTTGGCLARLYTLLAFIYSPKVTIKFDGIDKIDSSLEDFKLYLKKSIYRDRLFWSSGFDVNEIIDTLMKNNEPEHIVSCFGKLYTG